MAISFGHIFKKSFGLEGALKEGLKNIKGIRAAIIFGSYAKGQVDKWSE